MNISVSTVAGNDEPGFRDGNVEEAMFCGPSGICKSDNGDFFFVDRITNCIRMISDGIVSTIAGCGQKGFKDGKAENAMFHNPRGICISEDGKLYISDYSNHCIRMISDGRVSTIAGCGRKGFKDGKAKEAMFDSPTGICISHNHDILITDRQNDRIRMISKGMVSTIAGNGEPGFRDGKAENAMFNCPMGICMSENGKIYISDLSNNRIRMISDGIVSTIAGCGESGFRDGKAQEAMFNEPNSIILSNYDDNIYVSDWGNSSIRMISKGIVSTIAGNGEDGFRDGKAENAMFRFPHGICMSDSGRLYVTDYQNNRIRLISGLPNSPATFEYFELNSLIQSKLLSDMTLTINNHQYKLHTSVLESLCPMIVKHKSIIENAKISNQAIQVLFSMIYSNNTKSIRKPSNEYKVSDLIQLIELIWLLESFNIKNQHLLSTCVKQFKKELKYFLDQEEYKSPMQTLKFDLLRMINYLIVFNAPQSFKTSKLSQILHYSIDQIKKQIENGQDQSTCTDEDHEDATMSMPDMFTMFGLNTEPKVVNQEQIESETILQRLKLGNMTIGPKPDFKIMTHDRSFKIECHKLILCGKWSYFRRMMESGLSESSSGEMVMSEDWNSTRLYDFVKYLYTREVGFESFEDSVWLLKNAELYELMEMSNNKERSKTAERDYELLIDSCREKAFEVIDSNNCCAMYRVSLEIGSEDRKKDCYSYLVQNIIELMKNEDTRNEMLKFGREFIGKVVVEHYEQS